MKEKISVRIMSPVAVVWEAAVSALTAENSEGVFDILPDHAHFMSLVNNSPISMQLSDGGNKEFTFENALLFCADNKVTIYIQESLKAA